MWSISAPPFVFVYIDWPANRHAKDGTINDQVNRDYVTFWKGLLSWWSFKQALVGTFFRLFLFGPLLHAPWTLAGKYDTNTESQWPMIGCRRLLCAVFFVFTFCPDCSYSLSTDRKQEHLNSCIQTWTQLFTLHLQLFPLNAHKRVVDSYLFCASARKLTTTEWSPELRKTQSIHLSSTDIQQNIFSQISLLSVLFL